MRRWKKITIISIFSIIILAIGLVQNILIAILCICILAPAYYLINIQDEHRKITSNRYDREKYHGNTRKR